MAKVNKKRISDLKFDAQNINRGSAYGSALLEKSIQEVGLGRSVLTDMNNVIIAGNKTAEKAGELGFEDVIEIESTGRELIVVKRVDIDINSETGAKMKILDNTVSKHNYVEDVEVMDIICDAYDIEPSAYGLTTEKRADEKDDDAKEEPTAETQWFLNIRCESEEQAQQLYNEFLERGHDVKIVT